MAAITLKQGNPGYIDRHGVGADAMDKAMDKLRLRYNSTPLQGATLFRTVSNVSGGVYKEGEFGNKLRLPVASEDTDKLFFATPIKGFTKSFTIATFRLAVQVERSFPEDQVIPIATKLMSGLMNTGRLLLEYEMANVWNQATSSSYVGADGLCMASAVHPFERAAAGTYSNIESSVAFSAGAYATARKNMRKRKDEFGNPNPLFVSRLVIPADLETTAKTFLNSTLLPGGALNDANVWKDEPELFVWDYITSTTAWGLVARVPAEDKSLVFVQAVAPNIAPCTGDDTSTDVIWAERLRMRYAIGHMVPRDIQYSAGA